MNRKALGKGIHALIPDFEMEPGQEPEMRSGPTELLIDEISPNRLQPRKYFDDEKFHELVESVRENGILQPVVVQKVESGYELIVGERRWRASKKAGLKKIPAVIREVTDTKSLELALIENLHRQDLNPIEEAEAYSRLSNEFGQTQEEIGKSMGKSRAAIANTLRLLKLPRAVKADIISSRLSMGHARALLGLEEEKDIETLRREIVNKDLNVRQTESRVRHWGQTGSKKPHDPGRKDIFLKSLEKEFERRLGTKVTLAPSGQGGKLTILYYSDDDLERIRSLIIPKIH
ncbi:MAG: chromosome partitioning protein ParB [Nitrospinae bacterium CG11_big_fil_rev_8_21_14_0_20_56_8]|nr:MAG: chromosome partitioning protein ParB [Nitrospinae bacterium CG11_big_fil_rev_8_21_14_0_20_56_8]